MRVARSRHGFDLHRDLWLSASHQLHKIAYDSHKQAVQVTIYTRHYRWDTSAVDYTYLVWPRHGTEYNTSLTRFHHPNATEYDWGYLDRLIVTPPVKPILDPALRYWRTRFILLPSDNVPDRTYLQVSDVDENASEEEIRLAGVIKIFELFQRARWTADGAENDDQKKQISYAFTTVDPSAFVHSEAFRETALRVPLGDTLGAGRLGGMVSHNASIESVAIAMTDPVSGLALQDRRWQ